MAVDSIPFKIPFSFLSGEVVHTWDISPFFVSYHVETSLEIDKLLLQLPIGTEAWRERHSVCNLLRDR